ncbi:enolase C-terminal domain-like protein [Streptomyces sp. JV176]|uniref:mandelate racemase/muconate lactonizing enzyme family protein n=1 Tax=Streptomyces sp. JV176 TaxID=858630 RepID=UPI002E781003|nr:enolase C-terminal domain-like protein [Streptomyces sp. JV176]MEE1802080.1 enolase C-terminal domain-like protein [Streptomyces sp. JV176]
MTPGGRPTAPPAVTGAEYGVVGLPLRLKLRHHSVETAELTEVFLRVRLADGATGWAETRGNGAYATHHTADSISAALAGLPPVGDPAWADPATLATGLAAHCPPAAALLDIAWRDAAARSRGLPLWATLRAPDERDDRGGPGTGAVRMEPAPASVPVRVAHPPLPTHAPIGFGTPEEAAALAVAAAEAGFGRVKIRVGGDQDRDRARVSAVRGAVDRVAGAGAVVLAADANGGWDVDTARAATRWLADHGVAWLEQPTPPGDLAAMAAVRVASPVPVWADESVRDAASVHAVADAGAADGVHLKLEKAGTVEALAAAFGAARSRGLAVGLGQMDCGRLGCATTAHLAAGLRIEVAELWGCAHLAHDVTDGLTLHRGAVRLPDGAGLGVRVGVDPAALTPVGTARAPLPSPPDRARTYSP